MHAARRGALRGRMAAEGIRVGGVGHVLHPVREGRLCIYRWLLNGLYPLQEGCLGHRDSDWTETAGAGEGKGRGKESKLEGNCSMRNGLDAWTETIVPDHNGTLSQKEQGLLMRG